MKKFLLPLILSLASLLIISGCSASKQTLATYKGGKLTVHDFYEGVKLKKDNQLLLKEMIAGKAFTDLYGKKVSDQAVEKVYQQQATAIGKGFTRQLKQLGYTKESYKDYIKQSLAFDEGLNDQVHVTNQELNKAFNDFHPTITAQIISTSDQKKAADLKKQLTAGGDFTKLAKKESNDSATKKNGGNIKFDSQATSIPTEVKTTAFKLKNGETSDVISATDPMTNQTSYYLLKMKKNPPKGSEVSKSNYKKEVKQIAIQTKLTDPKLVNSIIEKVVKKDHVSIKDHDLSDLFKKM